MIHLIGEYAIYALLAEPGSLPAGELGELGLLTPRGSRVSAFWCSWRLLFPNGRLPSSLEVVRASERTLDVGRSGFSGVLSRDDRPRSPWHSQSAGDRGPAECLQACASTHVVLIAISVASLLLRRVYARGVERQQTKWFTYTTAVAASGAILQYIISEPFALVWLGGWIRTRSHRPCRHPDLHGDRDNALPPLRDRPHHQRTSSTAL